jgi:nucleotidyltransferase substrate binding protein (TIGR01987 family)
MDSIAKRTIKRFKTSVEGLERALKLGPLPDNANQDAVLLRFELCAELMPKVLKRILSEREVEALYPKDIIRLALAGGIIQDESVAQTMIAIVKDRNRMVHDYSEEYALELLQKVRAEYAPALKSLASGISPSLG